MNGFSGPRTILGYDTGPAGPYNIANKITMSRLLFPAFVIASYYFVGHLFGIIFAAIVFATDFDGWVARRNGCASDFGAFLDPTVDKICMAVLGVWAAFWPIEDAFLGVVLMLLSQLAITVYSVWQSVIKQRDLTVTMWGKWTIGIAMVSIIAGLLIEEPFFPENGPVYEIAILSGFVAFLMGVHNLRKYVEEVRNMDE